MSSSPEPETAPSATPNARLEPGFLVAERYRIGEPLGEGGMGVVYSAEHLHMRKLFALKVLHRELLRLPEVVARFEREAVLAGSIDHPNVAAATDFGKLEDGSFYLVLELVTGVGLRSVIEAGPIEIVRAHGIMRGITAGIVAAHAKGIVHRDLKPENVMLVERDGNPDFAKVLDFGIAKGAAAEAPSASPLTQIGTIMGTPQYMAPEQALGQLVDQRSDLYSLGVIFYEMVTGQPPFTGEALVVLRHHIATEAPAIPPELTAGLTVPIASIIAKLLAKDPAARFRSAAELAAALEEPSFPVSTAPQTLQTSAALDPPSPSPARHEPAPAPSAARRKLSPKTLALIAAGASVLGIGLVVAFSGPKQPRLTTNEVQAAPVEISNAPPAASAEVTPAPEPTPTPTAEAEPETPEPAPTNEPPVARTANNERPESPSVQNARAHGVTQGKVYKKRGPIGQLGQDVKHLFGK